jgi:hypothetical protein
MPEPDGLAAIREAIAAFNAGHPAELMTRIAADAVFVIPGNSPVSGTYRGNDEVARFFGKVAELAGGSQRVEVLHTLSGGAGRVVVIWQSQHGARASTTRASPATSSPCATASSCRRLTCRPTLLEGLTAVLAGRVEASRLSSATGRRHSGGRRTPDPSSSRV